MFFWGVIFEKCFESNPSTELSSIAEGWGGHRSQSVLIKFQEAPSLEGSWKGPPEARQVLGLSGAQPIEGAGNMCSLSTGIDGASKQSEINCLVLLNLNPSS